MKLTLNGRRVQVEAHPLARLLDVLREECGLPGTKEGCGEGECGACTVLLDGQPVNACLVPFAHVEGARVTTIEGLNDRRLLEAFHQEGGAQCGFCTPGMLMAAASLPKDAAHEELQRGLAGNLCRCTGYTAIYRAIETARKKKAAGARSARRRDSLPARAAGRRGFGGAATQRREPPRPERRDSLPARAAGRRRA